ncbi:MAG: hypothetical protein AB7P33_14110 [Dehalococcoidia bacterium]
MVNGGQGAAVSNSNAQVGNQGSATAVSSATAGGDGCDSNGVQYKMIVNPDGSYTKEVSFSFGAACSQTEATATQ